MRPALLVVAALLVLSGCTTERGPGLEPAGDTPEPTTEASTASPSTGEPEATPDPLRFPGAGGLTVVSCFPDGPRRFLVFGQVSARREVTLTGISGGGQAATTRGGWVAPLPRRSFPENGVLDLDAGGTAPTDLTGWADRERLRGAVLSPCRRYTYFVTATLRPDRTLDDLLVGWSDAAGSGRSTIGFGGRTQRGGC